MGSNLLTMVSTNGADEISAVIIEFDIEKRNIRRDDKPATIRVLRVSSYVHK
jgi:hypothetical protein